MNFFITATDTDVGKTFVTAALLSAINQNGQRAIALKPVQTGCENTPNGKLVAPDVQQYRSVVAENDISPCYAFRLPASPHYAAQLENQVIEIPKILSYIKQQSSDYDVTLIEGAGGIFVPLNQKETMLDLMIQCHYPVILVCPNVLGVINSVLMSIETLHNHGLSIAALVLNFDDENDEICRCNREYLQQHTDIPLITLSRFASADIQQAVPYLQKQLSHLFRQPENQWDTDFDKQHLWHPYTNALNPLPTYPVVSASNYHIHTTSGRLIDGMSSWWCAAQGYNNQALNQAAIKQLHQFSHIMFAGLTHQPAIELGKKLLQLLPDFSRVFYSDSGSVAVEVALKLALQYQQKISAKKTKMLTVLGGYHGDTLGAMSVCDPVDGMHFLFNGVLAQHIFAPRPTCRFDQEFDETCLAEIEQLFAQHQEEIAAVIIEPIVQGAGGMWFYHPKYLQHLRKLCNQYNALLIFDEIATGFGRTGKLFAYQHADVVPDIICVGKALTAGYMTLAATICQEHIAEVISQDNGVFMHGPTFMANPLACAVAAKNIELLQQGNWQQQVQRIENIMQAHLAPCKRLPETQDVRVLGAIGVVELKESVDIQTIQAFFVEKGVWIRPFGRLIYLMPPFIIADEDLIYLCQTIFQAISYQKYRRKSC